MATVSKKQYRQLNKKVSVFNTAGCLAVVLFCFFSFSAGAQDRQQTGQPAKVRKIEIVNANSTEFDASLGTDAKRLIGNVIFKHGDAVMYCDSAYYFSDENVMDAYSHIHIIRNDTLHLYGDFLKYIGNEKLAEVRDNVKLVDNETTLTTDYLDFNIRENYGYYTNGGDIVSGQNNLRSEKGYYYANTKTFFFKDSVVINNPDYDIYSDTLRYNTESKIAWFYGPTEIISDENYIYCENGWYDTDKDISQFNKNAWLKSKDQILRGDSLYYERNTGFGQAFNNVQLRDLKQNVILQGNFAEYYEEPESALLTDSAVFMQITDDKEKDTIYVHADTLRSVLDTTGLHKIIKAYYKVKIFEKDLQGKCDSLAYSFADSTIRLYREPVLWSADNQLTAEYIEIQTKNGNVDKIVMENTAFIISKVDSVRFNQIKGKKMTGYFKDNELSRINVDGNGQTIYFARDRNMVVGVNKAESSSLIIYLQDRKIKKINFINKPEATLYPPFALEGNDLVLKDFKWYNMYRPLNKRDIFIWKKE